MRRNIFLTNENEVYQNAKLPYSMNYIKRLHLLSNDHSILTLIVLNT